jgi:hypothetical protein
MNKESLNMIKILHSMLILTIFFVGCEQRLAVVEKEHLDRYPEMRMFLVNMTEFLGILHDTQSYYFAFAYKVNFASSAEYFKSLDELSAQAGWRSLHSDDVSRLLIFTNRLGGEDIGYVEYSPETKWFLFLGMSRESWERQKSRNTYKNMIVKATGYSWNAFNTQK